MESMKFKITKKAEDIWLFNGQEMHYSVLYRTAKQHGFKGNFYKLERLLEAIDQFPEKTITFNCKDE